MKARTILAAGLSALAIGCTSASEPSTGILEVAVATEGGAQDLDGYTVKVEGGPSQQIGSNASIALESLEPGDYRVTLEGLEANCRTAGIVPRPAKIVAGSTTRIDFVVICAAEIGELEVVVETTGSDIDANGYALSLSGSAGRYIAPNGSTILQRIPQSEHSVAIVGVERNCTASPSNPTSVLVAGTQRATLRLAFTCSNQHGALRVAITPTGDWQDQDGFAVLVDGSAVLFSANVASVPRLLEGDHELRLTNLDPECVVEGGNPRTIRIVAGETLQMTITVRCTTPPSTSLVVNVTTTGGDLDPDGYVINIQRCPDPYSYYYACDYSATQRVSANGSVSFSNLRPGPYEMFISDLSSNCLLVGSLPTPGQVNPPGATLVVTVNCTARADLGQLTVSVTTTGTDLDLDGYSVYVTGASSATLGVPSNGSVTFVALVPGVYTVQLLSLAPNCTTASTTLTVTVPARGTGAVLFNVLCSPQPTLNIDVTTSGGGTDANGYQVTLFEPGYYGYYYVETKSVLPNGFVTFRPPAAGTYSVRISDLAGNCTSNAINARTIAVGPGVTTYPISVICTP